MAIYKIDFGRFLAIQHPPKKTLDFRLTFDSKYGFLAIYNTLFFHFTKCTLFIPPLSSCFCPLSLSLAFSPRKVPPFKSRFQIGWSFLFFFTFSSIMSPLTSYSFTLLCWFMDEWIRPIIITLFWFLMDELSQLTLTLIFFLLDVWTKPTTLTSLCFFMDEWIKPMRLTLLLIFHGWIKPLAFTLFCFFMDERQMMAPHD